MVIPRPALIALLGAALAVAAFTASRSLGGSGADDAGTPAAAAQAPAAPGQGAHTRARPKAASKHADEAPGVPRAVERALARHKVVVLLFTQRGGADDAATRAAVRAIRHEVPQAVYVSDDVSRLGRYGRLVSDLGISQAPAIVIVKPGGEAELIEGFTDAGSLAQQVADAL
jgi:hypothetical protein